MTIPLIFAGSAPSPAGAQQVLILPYLRRSPIHIPRRDLVLSASDSLTLRVTVVESDDPSAHALETSVGLGAPLARLRYRGGRDWHWDYGWPWRGARELLEFDGVVSTAAGSFDFFLPTDTLACLSRRCGWAVHLTWDDSGTGVAPGGFGDFSSDFSSDFGGTGDGAPILVGGFQQSELLACGVLHIRWAGRLNCAGLPLLTDPGFPVLTD